MLYLIPIVLYLIIIRIFIYRSEKVEDLVKSNEKNFEINEYHNEAIYKSLEFYIKVSIAIITGIFAIFFLFTKEIEIIKKIDEIKITYLITSSTLLYLVITILFTTIILSHKWSKMRRWKDQPKFFDFLIWSDFWMIFIMNIISIYIYMTLRPELISILSELKNN